MIADRKLLEEYIEARKKEQDWSAFAFAAGPLVILLGIELLSPWALVTQLPRYIYFAAAILGLFYAHWIARDILAREAISGQIILLLVVLYAGYSIGIMPYLLRSVIVFAAFLSPNTDTEMQNFLIERGSIGRWPGTDTISVNPYLAEGRSTRVRATYDLAAEFTHVSERRRHCIKLETQTGQRGIVRVRTHSVLGSRQTGQNVERDCV